MEELKRNYEIRRGAEDFLIFWFTPNSLSFQSTEFKFDFDFIIIWMRDRMDETEKKTHTKTRTNNW